MRYVKSFLLVGFLVLAGHAAAADEEIGKVVAIRGKATIERGSSSLTPGINSGVHANDIIKTAQDCRIKLRFIDDSVLTIGNNSRMVVKEFVYSKEKGGKSIFNLMDGKMHSIVGKTKFEVHTPTAVAAARGTVIYFEVGKKEKTLPGANISGAAQAPQNQ